MSQQSYQQSSDKAESSLSSSCSLKMPRFPTLTSSQRMGVDSPPSLDRIEPHIALLNEKGLVFISQDNFQMALKLFQEGQRLLELGAGCGKSIDRQLVLTILTNKAYLYQKQGKLECAKSYLEAVIYNLTTYLEHPIQMSFVNQLNSLQDSNKSQDDILKFMQLNSSIFRTYLNRTHQLSVAQLQYAQLLSQEDSFEAAGSMADKSIRSMMEHLSYCQFYQNNVGERQNEEIEKVIQNILDEWQKFGSLTSEQLQKQISSKIHQNCKYQEYQLSQKDRKYLNQLQKHHFLQIKIQEYQGSPKLTHPKSIKQIQTIFSLKGYIEKHLAIACTYFLISELKIRELTLMKNQPEGQVYFFRSEQQFEELREASQKLSQLCSLTGHKIILEYLPLNAALPMQILEDNHSGNVKRNEEMSIESYFIRVNEAVIDKTSNLQKVSEVKECSDSIEMDLDDKQMQADMFMKPPVVQTMALDLSSATSVDLVSDSSMIDVFKNADLGSEDNKDSEVYFQFMAKQSSNSNPLFQATMNLLDLKNQTKNQTNNYSSTFHKQSMDVSLQQMIEGNNKRKQEQNIDNVDIIKTEDEEKDYLMSMGKIEQKVMKKKSFGKFTKSGLLTHSVSTNSIYLNRKSKSRGKNLYTNNLQSLRLNLKSQQKTKKANMVKSKPSNEIQPKIKLNRVKSPFLKLKKDKTSIATDLKRPSKSKSNNKSLKSKSKSKSLTKKMSQFNSQKPKVLSIYVQGRK